MSFPARYGPAWAAWLGLALLLIVLPFVFSSRLGLSLLSQMGIAGMLCLSYWLLLGQGGLLSFGHAVYSGAGAFMVIHALARADPAGGLPVMLLPLVGGVVAAVLALPTGWLATRQSPTAFAMITLGLGELAGAVALMFPAMFGGESGLSGDRTVGPQPWGISLASPQQLYFLVAVYTLFTAWAIHGYTQSPPGRLLNAVRDNPERVAFMGHDPRQLRLLAFVVSAFFAGMAGGLSALLNEIVTTEVLGSQRSAAVLVFTFMGGVGSFLGPLLGGVLMVLGQVLLSAWSPAWLLYLGLLFLVMVVAAPGGAMGWLRGPRARIAAPLRLWLCLSLLLALLGAGALIEMAYQLRLADTLGSERQFMGVMLDAHAPSDWLGAGSLSLLAGLAWWRLRRRLRWQEALE